MIGILIVGENSNIPIAGSSFRDRQKRMLVKAHIKTIYEVNESEMKLPVEIDAQDELLILDARVLLDDRFAPLLYKSQQEMVLVDCGARLKAIHWGLWLEKKWEQIGQVVFIKDLDIYRPERRVSQPFLHMTLEEAQKNESGLKTLLKYSQNGILDWPARWIHRPLEDFFVKLLCPTSITPNQITVLNNVVAFLATAFFTLQYWKSGLFLALVAGVLDGVDGKLARVKQMTTEIGEWEHHLDKVYENSWYLAIAYGLFLGGLSPRIFLAAIVVIFFNAVDLTFVGWFRRRFNRQFDDLNPATRAFRIFAGRRNTYMWSLIPFILVGEISYGMSFLALYAGLSLLVKVILYLRNY